MERPKMVMKLSALLISILIISLALLITTAESVHAATTPSISLSDSNGPPGTSVTVSGSGFTAGETEIYVVFDDTTVDSDISTSSGSWSTTFTVPNSASGSHSIYAYGPTSGEVGPEYFDTTPIITLNKTEGAPGTSVTVTGAGFADDETSIKIIFDSTTIATGISAGSTGDWSSSFIVPASEAGTHKVKASGSSTTSVTAVSFETSSGVSLSKTSGPPGSSITVSGAGFVSGETGIVVTFDGDEVTSGITAGSTGSWSSSFIVPQSSGGSHTISAYGASTTAGSISDTSFKTTAIISLNKTSGPPGSSITVTGAGFKAGETNISITFDSKAVGSSTTANSIGSWTITFTVPSSSAGSHAIATSSSITGSVSSATFITGAGISLNNSSAAPGSSITVSGAGFAANETGISITFDGKTVTSSIKANESGAWDAAFTVPSSASGTHTIKASGAITSAASVSSASFSTSAMISINQTSGLSGSLITVTGTGFAANETGIAVTFDKTTVASSIKADSIGAWSAKFNVPSGTSGSHTISASGSSTQSTGATQSAFDIAASVGLSPTTGYIGSTVSINGTGFAANSPLRIIYDDTEITLNGATTDAIGNVSQSITIPVSKAGTHNITVKDAQGNSIKSSFVISSTPPTVPTGQSPKDNSTVSITGNIMPVFKWTSATSQNGVKYELQIATDPEFSDLVLDKTDIQTNKYTLNASESLSRGQYYWRVKAIDLAANQSSWSDTLTLKSGVMAMWLFILIIILAVAAIGCGVYFGLIRLLRRKREAITVSEVEAPVFNPGQWQALESGEASKEREAPRRIALPEVSKTSKTLATEDQARLKVIMDFASSMPLVEPDYNMKWLDDLVESQQQTQMSIAVYEQLLKGESKLHYEPTWMRHPVYKDLTVMLQKQPILQKLDAFVSDIGLCGTDAISLIHQIYTESSTDIPADFLARGGWSYLTSIYVDAINWYAGKSLHDPSERDYKNETPVESEKGTPQYWLSGESTTLFAGRLISAQDEKAISDLRSIHLKLRRLWRNNEKVRQMCSSITQLQIQRSELINAFNQFGRTK